MTDGWEIVPMGQLCSIKSGKSDTKDAVEDGAYAFFDRSRTIKRSTRYLYDCEALILPGEGAEFLPKHFTGKFDLHQRAYALFGFSNRIDVKYLYYFLHHQCDYFPRVAVGATVKSLRLRHFQQLPVCLTGLPEQRRIVGILDEAFEDAVIAKASAERNLANARALFDGHLQNVFMQRGEGWAERRLEEVGSTQTGSTPKTSNQDNYGTFIPFVKPSDFNSDGSLAYENHGLSAEGLSRARRIAAESVLMVCIGATIGKCGYSNRDVATNQQVNTLTPRDGVSPKFVYYQMLGEDFQRRVILNSAQATLPIISKAKWRALTIAIPPTLREQQLVVAKLDALRAQTRRLESIYLRKLGALEELKKSLLHEAFSGRLTKDAA